MVILTPNDLHFPMILEASSHGKIVLCEKPMAISVAQAERLKDMTNVFSVLQLRYHPAVEELLKERQNRFSEIMMDISVYRDSDYYAGWKGQGKRSGGVLFNLGIHYFDLLLHVFGQYRKIRISHYTERTVEGRIEGERWACNFRVSTDEPKETQRRVFMVNGKRYVFSVQENLSFENLHRFVYQNLVNGQGFTINDCLPAIKLIEEANHEGRIGNQNLASRVVEHRGVRDWL